MHHDSKNPIEKVGPTTTSKTLEQSPQVGSQQHAYQKVNPNRVSPLVKSSSLSFEGNFTVLKFNSDESTCIMEIR